jgi:hypothetical protein
MYCIYGREYNTKGQSHTTQNKTCVISGLKKDAANEEATELRVPSHHFERFTVAIMTCSTVT